LDCSREQVILGQAFFTDVEYDFEWSSMDGNIIGSFEDNTALVDEAVTYLLKVTNPENGCTNEDEVSVLENVEIPSLNINAEQTSLNCSINELEIESQTEGSDLSFEWNSQDGNIISDSNTPNIQIDAPGTYNLIITDNLTIIIGLLLMEKSREVKKN